MTIGIDGTETAKFVRPGAPGGVINMIVVELYSD